MKGLTIKQIFKALEESNNMKEVIGEIRGEYDYSDLIIYIDDVKEYEGHSWKEFYKHMKKEYIEGYVEKMMNVLIVGCSKTTFFDTFGHPSTLEVYYR